MIAALYEKAGTVDSVWPETKINKAVNECDKKKKSYAGKKKKEKEVAQGVEVAWEMGEDAAEAAMPRTKEQADVDKLAGRLQKATVPDSD